MLAGAVLTLGLAVNAHADYFFNFNGPNLAAPGTANQSAAIATYMNNAIGGGCAISQNCVTVSGLDVNGNPGSGTGFGVAVAQKYNGDGHVVGPNGVSLTLGNSENAPNNSVVPGAYGTDYYISNTAADSNGANPVQLSQGILITFSHGISLTGTLSFDYQVFPDGTTEQPPDLTFAVNGNVVKTFLGVAPSSGLNGTSTKSPISMGGVEASAQLIGTYSTTVTNATQLSFLDWPATIGIDNLKLVTPEPKDGVFLLAGLALIGLVGNKLRRAFAKS